MTEHAESPRERLYWLLRLLQQGQLGTEEFCQEFEQTYNFELDKEDLSSAEAVAFAALFDKVVWFSPFAEDRGRIPNYLGEAEVRAAVHETLCTLTQVEVPSRGNP